MKLLPAPEDHEDHLYQRLVSDDGTIEMGIYPVMFGYRVRAGYVGEDVYFLDWCGGKDQGQVELLYSMMKNVIENKGTLSGIPICSNIKPYFNDQEFIDEVNKLKTSPLELIKLQPLSKDKEKMMKIIYG